MCSACFPSAKSAGRRSAFLHRVLQGEFPSFNGTIRALRLRAARLAAIRILRLAIPRLHSGPFRSQTDECVARAWSLSPGASSREFAEDAPGSPKFLGNLDHPLPCSKPTPAGLLALDHYVASAWPLVIARQRLPRLGLSTLNRMAFGLAVYASQRRLPDATQDSVPAAGQALLDGVLIRKVPMKGFRATSRPPFPSFLAQTMQPTRVRMLGNCPRWKSLPQV